MSLAEARRAVGTGCRTGLEGWGQRGGGSKLWITGIQPPILATSRAFCIEFFVFSCIERGYTRRHRDKDCARTQYVRRDVMNDEPGAKNDAQVELRSFYRADRNG
jgi:hypothetical protein